MGIKGLTFTSATISDFSERRKNTSDVGNFRSTRKFLHKPIRNNAVTKLLQIFGL